MANTTGKKWGGRKKGTANKVNATVKENILQVFDNLGGTLRMTEWAKENPTEFYKHYAKILPIDVNSTQEKPFEIVIRRRDD